MCPLTRKYLCEIVVGIGTIIIHLLFTGHFPNFSFNCWGGEGGGGVEGGGKDNSNKALRGKPRSQEEVLTCPSRGVRIVLLKAWLRTC